MQVSGMQFDRLPQPLRVALFAAATGLILYLSLAPAAAIPSVDLWDKAQHALSFAGLTALGLGFWPGRWKAVAGLALGLGLAIEGLQANMGLGRHGDWRDVLADAVGVLVALRLVQALRWVRRPR